MRHCSDRRYAASTLTLALLVLGACGGGTPATQTPTGSPLDLRGAVAAARAEAPGGTPIEVERETRDDVPLLEVELLEAGEVRALYYDPSDGRLVHEEIEDVDAEEAASLPALAAALAEGDVTLEGAIDFALEAHDEPDVQEIELEMHDDVLVVEVVVLRGGAPVALVYDARTQAFLGEEDETEEEGEPAG